MIKRMNREQINIMINQIRVYKTHLLRVFGADLLHADETMMYSDVVKQQFIKIDKLENGLRSLHWQYNQLKDENDKTDLVFTEDGYRYIQLAEQYYQKEYGGSV